MEVGLETLVNESASARPWHAERRDLRQDSRRGRQELPRKTAEGAEVSCRGKRPQRGGRQSKTVKSLLVSVGLDCLPADSNMLADKRGKKRQQQRLTDDEVRPP